MWHQEWLLCHKIPQGSLLPSFPLPAFSSLHIPPVCGNFSYFPWFPIPLGHPYSSSRSPAGLGAQKIPWGERVVGSGTNPRLRLGPGELWNCVHREFRLPQSRSVSTALLSRGPNKPNLGLFSIPFIQQFLLRNVEIEIPSHRKGHQNSTYFSFSFSKNPSISNIFF